jgi:pimeloyl-ACP methyl ester carboxylesterase
VTRHVANLSTRAVRYLEAGSGKPLVFLHAFPFSAEQWLPQLARVPPGWRFVAPDLRGFGGTEPGATPGGPITIDTYATDIVELMAHIEMPRAVVCGLSMGGYVAMALARRAPARISGLVLADTRVGPDSPEGRAARDRMLDLLNREGPSAVATEMLPKLLSEKTTREQGDLVHVVRQAIEANSRAGIAAAIHAMKDRPDSSGVLQQMTCPSLVMVGQHDALTPPKDAQVLHEILPGSRLVTVPDAGHLSNLEAPQAFNRLLAEWLTEVQQDAEASTAAGRS